MILNNTMKIKNYAYGFSSQIASWYIKYLGVLVSVCKLHIKMGNSWHNFLLKPMVDMESLSFGEGSSYVLSF
jgi:hypothetical protein